MPALRLYNLTRETSVLKQQKDLKLRGIAICKTIDLIACLYIACICKVMLKDKIKILHAKDFYGAIRTWVMKYILYFKGTYNI